MMSLMYFIFFEEGLDAMVDDFFAFWSYFLWNMLFQFFQEFVNDEKSKSRKYLGLILQERL